MSKLKFFCIKDEKGALKGMFIAPDEATAREIAKKNNFKVDENTVFEDVTTPLTPEEIARNKVITGE